jgi:ATP-dependent DNA helicase DinG
MAAGHFPFFDSDSPLKSILPGFELRDGQRKMAEAVKQALREKQILVVEAGTGTGKTLSYLLPLLVEAKAQGCRVLVSTETKTLQSQILKKELPVIQQALKALYGEDDPIRAEVCLGAANYICKRKLQRRRTSSDKQTWYRDFREWERKTETGLISDYTGYTPPGFLSGLGRESDRCLGATCPNFQISHYFVARERWKRSDLLIVNHSLLARHFLGESTLLPEFRYAVIDEAHRFSEIFNAQAEETLSLDWLKSVASELPYSVPELLQAADHVHLALRNAYGLKSRRFRLTKALDLPELNPLLEQIKRLINDLENEDKTDLFGDTPAEASLQKTMLTERLRTALRILDRFCKGPTSMEVFSLVVESDDAELIVSPIDSSQRIQDLFLDAIDSVIFTSATLSVKGSLDYFTSQVGIDTKDPRFRSLQLPAPFDYRARSLLYIPGHLPEPGTVDTGFEQACIEEVRRLIELAEGGVLVVFSSLRSLQSVEAGLEGIRYPVYSSARYGAERAIELFRSTEDSVLLGLESYRQGLDIRGDHLRMVILVRLPFPVPDDPILLAREEREKENGRSAFLTLHLPEMILKMRQGFGRLIRSSEDRGVVAVLDPRVHTRSYGKTLLASLPPARLTDSFEELEAWWSDIFSKAPTMKEQSMAAGKKAGGRKGRSRKQK